MLSTGQPASPLLIDISRLIWRSKLGVRATGIDRVCLAYLRHYAPRARAVVQHRLMRRVLDMKTSQRIFAAVLAGEERQVFGNAALARIALGHAFDHAKHAGAIYLNVGHTGLDQPGLAGWLRVHRLRPVYLAHDLIPITHPQYCREGEAERHVVRMTTMLTSARGVIANSAVTAESLRLFARTNALPEPPVLVSWLGTPELARGIREDDAEPYFVVIGTIEGRKNIDLLLDVWTELSRRPAPVPKLHIVGRRGWRCEATAARLDHDPALKHHIIEHGDLADGVMATLLRGASALLFPSFVEGYGLPLIEAMSLGTPALVSDIAAFREVGGGIPELFPPDDPAPWVAAIEDYASPMSARRSAQVTRLNGFRPQSWDDHFARVDEWLATLPRR